MTAMPASPVHGDAPPDPRRGPKVLLLVGVALLVVGVIALVLGANTFLDAAGDLIDDASEIREGLVDEWDVPGSTEVELDEGSYYVYAVGFFDRAERTPTTGEYPTATTEPDVVDRDLEIEVTGPDGAPVDLRRPGPDMLWNGLSADVWAIRELRVVEPGTYRIEARIPAGAEPAATSAGVGEKADRGPGVRRAVRGGVAWLAGMLLAGLGGLLLVIGLIWFAVAGSGRTPPGPPWGVPPGAGPYGPPPSWGAPGPGGWSPPPPQAQPQGWRPAPPPPPAAPHDPEAPPPWS